MPWRPWASRTVTVPEPDDAGTIDGLAYVLYRPDGESLGGVVVLHGAGSAKENHLDFVRACRAHGMSAVAFDQRGHGATGGRMDGRAIQDVATIASLLDPGPSHPVGLRGSSMGGWLALAAAGTVGADAVVAICPASGEGLLRGMRAGRLDVEVDLEAAEAMIDSVDTTGAASRLGERLLLLHAEGDEVVPVQRSRGLHADAPGSRLIVVPGGHHRSIQHDPELQAASLRFLAKRLASARG